MAKKRSKAKAVKIKEKTRRLIPVLKYVGFFAGLIMLTIASIGIGYQKQHKDDPIILGASFSTKYAEALGVDWRANFTALVTDLNINHFRLMSYWDTIEKSPGKYDFTDLDWQMDQAAQNNAKVSLAIGQRQPRWPECHIPSWANTKDRASYNKNLLSFVEVVVKRYQGHPALESYQLENEAANRHFGVCPEFDRELFTQEFELVRSIDPTTTLITNASNQSGVPLQGPVGDKVGFSIYKRAHFPLLGSQRAWSFWYVPSYWHSFRAALVTSANNNQAFVHELQAEPWGPKGMTELSREEQGKTMDPEKLTDIVEFAKKTGMKEIYLWGSEWWYWRQTQFQDEELWSTLYGIYRTSER